MAAPASFSNFNAALSLMHHVYFNPVIGALVRCGVPDHLDKGPLPASDLAQLAGMDALSMTRALRALAAFGASRRSRLGYSPTTPYPISFAIAWAAFEMLRFSIAPNTS